VNRELIKSLGRLERRDIVHTITWTKKAKSRIIGKGVRIIKKLRKKRLGIRNSFENKIRRRNS